jgi:hypothetical protein
MHRSAVPRRRVVGAFVASVLAAVAVAACSSDDTPAYAVAGCAREDLDGRTVARVWDETLLDLIRQVVPAPTEHARNLFHMSAAMWDAWAAYDPTADGYFVAEKHTADDVDAAREVAISFAAYRILLWRYATVADLTTAPDQLNAVMSSLCLRIDDESTEGDGPAALGNRIAAAVLEHGSSDGAREDERYVDSAFRSANDPLVVDEPGTVMRDPNAWQPLSLGLQLSQNGLPIPGNVQINIGPHWGFVTPFALPTSPTGTPIDPGSPPRLGDPATDDEFKQAALDVIRFGSLLDPADGVQIDVSPASLGNNSLGAEDGSGYGENPVTGEPYAPRPTPRADLYRAIAEYWADGPTSETPPGHWNLIANSVADSAGFERRLGGEGPVLDPLEWDVKTYFALNGAAHDAAIAAWGLKGFHDSVRPISMIRYMGGLGQSSDPTGPSYHSDGLPLEAGLVEVVTDESSRPGQRHEHLADHLGEIAVYSWLGPPDDPDTEVSGVGWIRAVDWVPYQRPTFVTPSFPGYVSGHSTFSRAAAEVLAAMTGSPYFPGGLSEWVVDEGELIHEVGPTVDVHLQWASYYDAADQAGISRLYGGIHIPQDDLAGRVVGSEVGLTAWSLARTYFDGTAAP